MKKSYGIQMSYVVPDLDKERAEKAISAFEYLLKKMFQCDEHLDLIYIPFKDNSNVPPDQIYKVRAALRRYRDKVSDNFNILKRVAFKCFVRLQPFSSDTNIVKLNKSFVSSISDLEKQVNRFIDLFSNLESKDFAPTLVKAVENIKKEISQLEQIIEDRIIDHIQNNILARTWVDSVSNELKEKVERKMPLSIELVNERDKSTL